MSILFITPSIPTRLARIRAFNLIKYLSRFHSIHLLSLAKKDEINLPEVKELKKYSKTIDLVFLSPKKAIFNAFLRVFSPLPLEVNYCRSKEMKKKVSEILKNYKIDLIYIKRLRSAQFVSPEQFGPELTAEGIAKKVPVILDSTDAMSLYFKGAKKIAPFPEKLFHIEEYLKYKIYEKKLAKIFKNWVVCSEPDQNYLVENLPKDVSIEVIPNGIDFEYYEPEPSLEPEKNSLIFSGVFSGGMPRISNIDGALFFYNKIFPKIKKEIPDAKLYICGQNYIKKVLNLKKDPNVSVPGFVPDLREWIQKSEVVICPIRTGTGTRNKILQAWALGRPVVSTTKGAEGLEYENGKNILIADKPEDFAKKIILLLKNMELQEELIKNGLETAKKYDMNIIIKKLNSLLSEA